MSKNHLYFDSSNVLSNIVKSSRAMHSCEWCHDRKLLINHFNRVFDLHFDMKIWQTPKYLDMREIARVTRRRRGGIRTRLSPAEQLKFDDKQELLKVFIFLLKSILWILGVFSVASKKLEKFASLKSAKSTNLKRV